MTSECLKEFEKLNTTTDSIYDLEDHKVLIIMTDGTNLTSWKDVKYVEAVMYVSEDLSDYIGLYGKYSDFKSLKAIVASNPNKEVIDMSYMFSNCQSLTDISSLRDWDVSNVENMHSMFDTFYHYVGEPTAYMHTTVTSLADISPLEDWDVSNVKDMQFMFANCDNIVDLSPLDDWDVSNVENMDGIFFNCRSVEAYPIWYDGE